MSFLSSSGMLIKNRLKKETRLYNHEHQERDIRNEIALLQVYLQRSSRIVSGIIEEEGKNGESLSIDSISSSDAIFQISNLALIQ